MDKNSFNSINFAHMTCHDLQAPLRHIEMYLNFLKEDLDESLAEMGPVKQTNSVNNNMNVIQKSCTKIRALVDNLMIISQLDQREPNFEHFDLNSLCAELAETLLESQQFDYPPSVKWGNLPKVYGDREMLFQALLNIIGNGLKYSQKGQEPVVWIEVVEKDKFSEIRISDSGIGIPDEKLAVIMKPYQRLWSESEYKGTGLGLSICCRILELHGGKLKVASVEGEGSTFSMILPASK